MIGKIIKTALSVAAIAYSLYIFTFFIDGEIGVILIAFFLIAPVLSLLVALNSRNRISVSFDCDAYVKKGSELEVTVKVEKSGRFPLSVIEIVPGASEVFRQTAQNEKKRVFRLSMLNAYEKTFSYRVPADIGGNGSVFIESIWTCGFFGFFRTKAKTPLPEPASVGVIPEIPEIKSSSQLFRAIADAVFTSDDDEENDTAMLFSANTSPGYEHREYVMGDPLKRINWKLSSKKDKLMVRLDEAVASVQPSVVLDLYRKNGADQKKSVLAEEKLLCAVFGLLTVLIKQGIACNFQYFGSSGEPVTESVDNPDYPAQLLLKVLAVNVQSGRRNFPDRNGASACACVVATTFAGGDFSSGIPAEDSGDISVIGIDPADAEYVSVPFWYLDENNNFKLV